MGYASQALINSLAYPWPGCRGEEIAHLDIPAGALIVVMMWIYYSAQIFLLGAEFTAAPSVRNYVRKPERLRFVLWPT